MSIMLKIKTTKMIEFGNLHIRRGIFQTLNNKVGVAILKNVSAILLIDN